MVYRRVGSGRRSFGRLSLCFIIKGNRIVMWNVYKGSYIQSCQYRGINIPIKKFAIIKRGGIVLTLTLQVVPKKDRHILGNLYSLYLHDLSKFTNNLDIGEDGAFHFDTLDSFWDVEGLSPYFVKHDDNIIGFLLLLERPFLKGENDFGVNDLFILNKFRGQGFGLQALEILFKEKRGTYFVIELSSNQPAVLFWKKVYKHLHIEFEERTEQIDDELCLVQIFTV